MLLTLAVRSLDPLLSGEAEPRLDPLEVPRFVRENLGLHGLNVSASLLSGWTLADIDRFRDVADKAACPCLVLVQDEPIEFGAGGAVAREAAADRFGRLATAANRLGCNAVAVGCKGDADEGCFTRTAESLKRAVGTVDRLELNVLIRPGKGLADDPVRLTELIKRVGGFRIGTLPDFTHARRSGDAAATLRKLAPYAGAIHASIAGFDLEGAHRGCDLAAAVDAIRAVGYQNTLAIDYEGPGDPVEDICRARDLLAAAIRGESEELDEAAAEEEVVEGAADLEVAEAEEDES